MKKIISLLLSMVLLLSLAACGVPAKEPEPPEAYVPSEDIEVVLTRVVEGALNGNIKVVTRRTSEKELKAMELTCLYYDASGKQLGEAEKIECTFSAHGKFSIWTFTATGLPAYAEAIVSSVTYADETKSVCPGVSTWVQTSSATFTVDKYEKAMADMAKTEAVAAEKCDAVSCAAGELAEQKLRVELTNNSEKEINEVIVYALWFDEAGAPIDMKGVLIPNAENVSAKNLKPEEKAAYKISVPEGAASAKLIVKEITFADNTTWENDFTYEWAFCNYKTAK